MFWPPPTSYRGSCRLLLIAQSVTLRNQLRTDQPVISRVTSTFFFGISFYSGKAWMFDEKAHGSISQKKSSKRLIPAVFVPIQLPHALVLTTSETKVVPIKLAPSLEIPQPTLNASFTQKMSVRWKSPRIYFKPSPVRDGLHRLRTNQVAIGATSEKKKIVPIKLTPSLGILHKILNAPVTLKLMRLFDERAPVSFWPTDPSRFDLRRLSTDQLSTSSTWTCTLWKPNPYTLSLQPNVIVNMLLLLTTGRELPCENEYN